MQQPATPNTARIISDNWQRVREEVATACISAGRPQDVTIVGVSKYVGPELTLQLIEAGCNILGENRPQSLWAKFSWMQEQHYDQPQWHMIGHLQRNKVRRTLPMISYLHSVDSLRLARMLSEEARRVDQVLPVLAEVNVTQDPSKTGMQAEDVQAFLTEACQLDGIELHGLMAMSSQFSGGDQARREFAQVRQLRDDLCQQFPSLDLSQLSMGMSGDFQEAITEGATMVHRF